MRVICVTGCSGYLGRQVVKTLLEKNFAVTGIDLKDMNEPSVISNKKFTFMKGDIVQKDIIQNLRKRLNHFCMIRLVSMRHLI